MIEILTKASEYGFTQGILGVYSVLSTIVAIFFYLRLEKCRTDHLTDIKELVKVVTQNTEAMDGTKELMRDISEAQDARAKIAAELVQSNNNLKEQFGMQGRQLDRIESKGHA